MPAGKKHQACSMAKIVWRLLVGAAFFSSVISVTASGGIAEDLWFLVRVVGSAALMATWAGLCYEYIECGTAGYDEVLLIVSGALSLLLGLTYVFVDDVNGYSIESLRYFIFSAFIHGLLLLLSSRRG